MKRVATTIRLPIELKKKLEEEAKRKGYTINDLIIFILTDYLKTVQE